MKIKKKLLIIFILSTFKILAQDTYKIEIPNFNDEYSKFVLSLENGDTEINYQNFRFSVIESQQFIISKKRFIEIDSLKDEMYKKRKELDYFGVIKTAKEILSIDYTDMLAHKILRETYKTLEDEKNEQKHKAILVGLLRSIADNGDGETCESGWPVIQISEEYFILEMLGAKLISQSLENENGICDRMIVQTKDGNMKTYYFEKSKVFEGYKKHEIK